MFYLTREIFQETERSQTQVSSFTMANLERIQERIDLLHGLIRQVEEQKPMVQRAASMLNGEPSYSLQDLTNLEDNINVWHSATTDILVKEVGTDNQQLHDFNDHWQKTPRNLPYKSAWKRRLQQAKTDLKNLIEIAKENDTEKQDEVWSLIHPFIASISRSRMKDGYFADAVEAACKSLNTRVREIVKAKTGDELDGARLMQRAFSVDNPIIRVSHDDSASGQDTQKGYMQIFSGVMTGIRNPKAHDNQTITREDALRKLIFISMLI